MQHGVTLDCQKIQVESQEQLQKAILNIGHTDHVDQRADPKEGRKKYWTRNKCLRIILLVGEKKSYKKPPKLQQKPTLYIYIYATLEQ